MIRTPFRTLIYENLWKNFREIVFSFLVHYPTGDREKARPVNAESHYLHYNLNDLNAEKIPTHR